MQRRRHLGHSDNGASDGWRRDNDAPRGCKCGEHLSIAVVLSLCQQCHNVLNFSLLSLTPSLIIPRRIPLHPFEEQSMKIACFPSSKSCISFLQFFNFTEFLQKVFPRLRELTQSKLGYGITQPRESLFRDSGIQLYVEKTAEDETLLTVAHDATVLLYKKNGFRQLRSPDFPTSS